jgi:hypothetical protein
MASRSQTTFICCHCRRLCRKSVRLKSHQRYCGSKPCQQARKNAWELDKIKHDSTYRLKRHSSKKAWYSKYPGDSYQSSYRANHPDYVSDNRAKQRLRASKATGMTLEKQIVKTDALFSENLVSKGFYVLIPYKKTRLEKQIVKTDALIIELRSSQVLQAMLSARSP